MFYDFSISVPANTPQAPPFDTVLPLTAGVINRIEIRFRSGAQHSVHCKLLYHEHQAWPTNAEGDFDGDGETISSAEHYDLPEEPYELKARCWSDADTYPHEVRVRVGILRPDEIEKADTLAQGITRLLALVGIKL